MGKVGFIGLGIRGRSIMNAALCCEECDVVAICDVHEDYMDMANEIVHDVKRVQEPYKKANRKMHPEDTVIEIAGRKVGGGHFQVIAGPCSIEAKEQMVEVSKSVNVSIIKKSNTKSLIIEL